MLRRTFLAQTALATGAVLLNQSCTPSRPTLQGPSIGLQLYTVRDEVPKGLEALIEKIGSLGYTHIETYGYDKGQFFGKTPKELRNLLYSNNLLTPSGHYGGDDFLKGDDDAWKKACEAAATLEQEYIIIPYLDEKMRKFADADAYTKFAERLNRAAKIAGEAGLKFAYHNHDFEFAYDAANKTSLFVELLTKTDPALVKFELDLYWVSFAGGDPIVLFYQNPGRFPLWHVKDMDAITRKNSDLGKGTIDFTAIFRHKKESGMQYFFVEQENYNVSPIDSIEKNIAYVKKSLIV